MSNQTVGSKANGSDCDDTQLANAVQQPARMSRLSRRTLASDVESIPASDTDEGPDMQAPAASSGRASRLSMRSAGTECIATGGTGAPIYSKAKQLNSDLDLGTII